MGLIQVFNDFDEAVPDSFALFSPDLIQVYTGFEGDLPTQSVKISKRTHMARGGKRTAIGVAYAEAEFQQREVVRQALRYQSDAQTLLLGVPMDGVKVSDLFDETTNKINLNKPYTPK